LVEKIRFAVLGCGRMGARRIKTIQENQDSELVCVSDTVETLGRKLANEAGCEYLEDFRQAATRHDVDVVIVSLPNKFHYEATVLALRKGKHVFCEKPMARNPQEACEMVKNAKENGRYIKVGSNLRYFPNVMKAKELVERKTLGELLFIRGWIGHYGKNKLGTWFLDADMAGGGTFLDNGCHILDLTRWFMGEVSECMGLVTTAYWPIAPLDDVGLGIFKFPDGKLAFIQSSWVDFAEYMYMEIYGREGFLRIDNRLPSCQLTQGTKEGLREVSDFSLFPSQSYKLELEDFIQAIRHGRQPLASGYDGMRAVQMAFGVYESSKFGRKIDLTAAPEKEAPSI
jgi:predicted dehydrogenase